MLPSLLRSAVAIALIPTGVAHAQLTVESGTAVELDPTVPDLSLMAGDHEDPSIQIMVETRRLTVEGALPVNIDAPGTYDGTTLMTTAAIPAGTVVDITLFHFDPPGIGPDLSRAELTVRFDGPVLGIIIASEDLNTSDAVARPSAPPPFYPTGEIYRGLEPVEDILELHADDRTFQMSLGVIDVVDELRVVSMSVPGPEADAGVPTPDAGGPTDGGGYDAGPPPADSSAPPDDSGGAGLGPAFHGSGVGCAAGGDAPSSGWLLLAGVLAWRRVRRS